MTGLSHQRPSLVLFLLIAVWVAASGPPVHPTLNPLSHYQEDIVCSAEDLPGIHPNKSILRKEDVKLLLLFLTPLTLQPPFLKESARL